MTKIDIGNEVPGEVIPIFIFSLPRAGSTLLQRIIATNPMVSTSPETWFMLHILSQMKGRGVYSNYSSRHANLAVSEFISKYVGVESFKSLTKDYINSIFFSAGKGKRYFLEKTPRNSYFIDELLELYGNEAFYIILLRNPLAIAMSMMKTWGRGGYNLYSFSQDFDVGLDNILQRVNDKRFLSIRYEDVVVGDIECLKSYLDLDFDTTSNLASLEGIMGDPTGQKMYKKIERERANAWAFDINTYTKRWILRRLAKKIGKDSFNVMGYSYEETLFLVSKISNYSIFFEFKDVFGLIYGFFYRILQPFIYSDFIRQRKWWALR